MFVPETAQAKRVVFRLEDAGMLVYCRQEAVLTLVLMRYLAGEII